MRWAVHGERSLYDSDWVCLSLADVELPDGTRLDHHVVRMPAEAAGVVVADPARGVLLLWRHRFITDTWGWEVPAGRVDAGETAEQARRPGDGGGERLAPRPVASSDHLRPAQRDQRRDVQPVSRDLGDATSVSRRIRTRPNGWNGCRGRRFVEEITAGRVHDGLSLTALLWALTFEIH